MTGSAKQPAAQAERFWLPNIRQPNLKDRVYQPLLNMIIDGKYRDNDMLPAALRADEADIGELRRILERIGARDAAGARHLEHTRRRLQERGKL
jgi:hypothetical protein